MGTTKTAFNRLKQSTKRLSKVLVASYLLDRIVLLTMILLAYKFSTIDPVNTRHAFNLFDPNLSYPYVENTVSVIRLGVIAVIVPGSSIVGIIAVLVPFPTSLRPMPRGMLIRRKLWEWNAGWLGLGLSTATATMVTEGLKITAGRPRPHLLDLCKPDLSQESIDRWRVGGLSLFFGSAAPIMVTSGICTAPQDHLRNGFASWPSGHASVSWAGLLYLSLFICAKFGVKFPLLSDRRWARDAENERRCDAAPPLYLVFLAYVPVGGAMYITISRYFDYRHHAFDIISGTILGISTACLGFYMYQTPLSRGSGWAWAARDRSHAFGIVVGTSSYGSFPLEDPESCDHDMGKKVGSTIPQRNEGQQPTQRFIDRVVKEEPIALDALSNRTGDQSDESASQQSRHGDPRENG